MNTQEARQVLIDYNKWRRGVDANQWPADIGAAIDYVVDCMSENTAYAITVLNLEAGMRDMLRVIETDIRKTGGNSRLEALLGKYANNLEGKK